MLQHFSKNKRGFTVVEVLVSIAIISILTTVILFNQSSYVETTSITNLADNVASTLVQAQSYGIAVRETAPGSTDFSASYGVSFNILGSGSPTSYIFFIDREPSKDGIYNSGWSCPVGGASECLEKVEILRGNTVNEICIILPGGNEQCNSVSRADITYTRPNLSAQIQLFNSEGNSHSLPNMLGVRIKFRSPSNLVRSVTVYNNGQISSSQ